jgi:hypothetical protein
MGRSFSQNFGLLTQMGQKLKIKNWWAVAFNVKCILWLFKNGFHSYMYSSALCGIVSICIGVILRKMYLEHADNNSLGNDFLIFYYT